MSLALHAECCWRVRDRRGRPTRLEPEATRGYGVTARLEPEAHQAGARTTAETHQGRGTVTPFSYLACFARSLHEELLGSPAITTLQELCGAGSRTARHVPPQG